MKNYDVVIAGGGIVGLATAWRILENAPGTKLLLLDKERKLAQHQTGRNSGVIHSGIYYKPGSAKALMCRDGYRQLIEFAEAEKVAHEICGKIIVATDETEIPRLNALAEKAKLNGLKGVSRIDAQGIRDHEPHATGLAGLHVPETGIIDYKGVCEKLAKRIVAAGGEIQLHEMVTALVTHPQDKRVVTSAGRHTTAFFINCGGVHSDRLARLEGLEPGLRITPFRGEYYAFKPEAASLVRHLIYPVPDPAFPFLGVHFTRMVEGGVECGPNAVLAFGREAYHRWQVNPRDTWEILMDSGFRILALKHWRMGLGEFKRSLSKRAFVKALQKLVPGVRAEMLEPRAAGIRAQALNADGSLVDDFCFVKGERSLHVLNAPSPAATACLAIAAEIAARYRQAVR